MLPGTCDVQITHCLRRCAARRTFQRRISSPVPNKVWLKAANFVEVEQFKTAVLSVKIAAMLPGTCNVQITHVQMQP
jgi:hypothetical protein